jgi:hypothetical protein
VIKHFDEMTSHVAFRTKHCDEETKHNCFDPKHFYKVTTHDAFEASQGVFETKHFDGGAKYSWSDKTLPCWANSRCFWSKTLLLRDKTLLLWSKNQVVL